jgi:hypothetical protein
MLGSTVGVGAGSTVGVGAGSPLELGAGVSVARGEAAGDSQTKFGQGSGVGSSGDGDGLTTATGSGPTKAPTFRPRLSAPDTIRTDARPYSSRIIGAG